MAKAAVPVSNYAVINPWPGSGWTLTVAVHGANPLTHKEEAQVLASGAPVLCAYADYSCRVAEAMALRAPFLWKLHVRDGIISKDFYFWRSCSDSAS